MNGRNPVLELFNIIEDPKELVNIAHQRPEKVKEMANIFFEESSDFLPPASWNVEKWKEAMKSEEFVLAIINGI